MKHCDSRDFFNCGLFYLEKSMAYFFPPSKKLQYFSGNQSSWVNQWEQISIDL